MARSASDGSWLAFCWRSVQKRTYKKEIKEKTTSSASGPGLMF